MSPDRAHRQEMEYRVSFSAGLLVSAAVHLLLFAVGTVFILPLQLRAEQSALAGYRGPHRPLVELEIMEPHSLQSFFHQQQRQGSRQAAEYKARHQPKAAAGPNPILVRPTDARSSRQGQPNVTDADERPHLPAPPLHTLLSTSQDFVILTAVKPEYPEYERSRGIEASILLACYVTAAGDIMDEQVMESETSAPGASALAFEQAALEAVRKWKVLPPLRDGEPRGAWLPIRVNFDLADFEPK